MQRYALVFITTNALHVSAVPPPIIRSSKLYTQHRVFVELFLLLTANVSSNSLTIVGYVWIRIFIIGTPQQILHANLLIPQSRVLPEKLTGPHLVKNFPAVCGTRKFSLLHSQAPGACPYPEPNQSSPLSPSQSLDIHFNIILP